MPVEVLMPALSPTMEKGTLAKWHVNEGDEVGSGDVIAEIETDKATMEVESVEEGRIGKLLIQEGAEDIAVNTPIAIILHEGEDENTPLPKTSADKNDQDKQDDEQAGNERAVQPNGADKEAKIKSGEKPEQSAEPPAKAEILSEKENQPQITVREALRDAMAEEMRRDEDIFIMGEEVAEYQGAYKVTQGLLEEFGGKRVVDTPITEYGFAGIGCGAALAGLRPIVEFMTFNFAMQAIDHIINSAAKTLYMSGGQMRCPIVFRGPNGAASRVGAQHSQDYSAWYASVPGLKVIAPYSAADAKGLLKAAIRDPNPVVFLENEILYGQSFAAPESEDHIIEIGKALIRQQGTDVTIVSYSRGLSYVHEAETALKEAGISAEIIDLRSLRPLDWETIINSVKKTNRLVVVEEGWPVCSIGSEICTEVTARAFDYLDAPPLKVSGKDVPMPYAANLEKLALPSAGQVVEAVKKVTYKN